MPERALKRKTSGDSPSSSVGEPEATSLRTENEQSMSHKDFSEISEKVERSVCRGEETENNQRNILKMIENISYKIASWPGRNSENTNTEPNRSLSENTASTSRYCETDGTTQDESLHSNTPHNH